jgi:hypothetical protein
MAVWLCRVGAVAGLKLGDVRFVFVCGGLRLAGPAADALVCRSMIKGLCPSLLLFTLFSTGRVGCRSIFHSRNLN